MLLFFSFDLPLPKINQLNRFQMVFVLKTILKSYLETNEDSWWVISSIVYFLR